MPRTLPRFRDPDGPELWERCGPQLRRADAGGPSGQHQTARALRRNSVSSGAAGPSAQTSRARCSFASTLDQSQWPPATVPGVDLPALPTGGGVDPTKAFDRPASNLRAGEEATAHPAPSVPLGPAQAIEIVPRVTVVVSRRRPHAWFARPCAPFRGLGDYTLLQRGNVVNVFLSR